MWIRIQEVLQDADLQHLLADSAFLLDGSNA